MKRQDSKSILAGPAIMEVQPGQYAGFMVRVVGTNQAGQTLTAANLGTLSGRIKGKPFYAVSFAATQTINNIDMGFIEAASAAGGAFTFSAFIPASRVGDGNIFDVVETDSLTIELDLSGVTAVIVLTGTVQLFGVPQEGSQLYLPEVFGQMPTIAASSLDDVTLRYDNISSVYVVTTTNLNRVTATKDGQSVVDATAADLQALSNADNRHEAAFTAGFKIDLNRSGSIGEGLSDQVKLSLETGAGGAFGGTIVAVGHSFTPAAFARSAALASAMTNDRLKAKVQSGKTDVAQVVKAVSAR